MDKHITIVAAINIAFGGILFALGLFLFVAIMGGGLLSGDPEAIFITGTVAAALGILLTTLGLPGLIGGFGLLSRKHWARFLIIVISVIDLINIPIGTIISVYTLWVMLNDETVALFS